MLQEYRITLFSLSCVLTARVGVALFSFVTAVLSVCVDEGVGMFVCSLRNKTNLLYGWNYTFMVSSLLFLTLSCRQVDGKP